MPARWTAIALISGLLAVGLAIALPLAPVKMSTPTVTWPQSVAQPESTMLELTAQQPLAIDVRFSCVAARLAGQSSDGVLLSTIRPDTPAAADQGLLVAMRDDQLRVVMSGELLVERVLPPGDCAFGLQATAERTDFTLDGVDQRSDAPVVDLPQVDVLATSIVSIPGGDDSDLGVSLRLDDQYSTSPTPLKLVLTVLMAIAVLMSLYALRRLDRLVQGPTKAAASTARPVARGIWILDVVVIGLLVLWTFIAPVTDDDGYYAAMARNADNEGFVGGYYQLKNGSFTPFTWVYRMLGGWQSVFDNGPVPQRIPALLIGIATWFLLRRLLRGQGTLPDAMATSRWAYSGAVLASAVAFLAWWLPYDMGVRPEGVVALLALGVLLCVLTAVSRQTLSPVALAVLLVSLAVTCHPTGFVAFAPLLAGAPKLWPLIRGRGTGAGLAARLLCVIAPGAVGAFAAFGDGSLRDFIRSQEVFLSIQEQSSWVDEWQRYSLLLLTDPQGNYAKRAAVLLAIVGILAFLALYVTARARRYELPYPMVLVSWSMVASFLLLWPTPSKWSHHFGALAGVGPAFLGLLIVSGPWLIRRLQDDRPLPATVRYSAIGVFAAVAALSWHGPNSWPYSWMLGVPQAGTIPHVGPLQADSLIGWVLGSVLVLLLVRRLLQRRTGSTGWRPHAFLVAIPLLAVLFLSLQVTYLVGSFSTAAARTFDTYSPYADAITDPLSTDCAAAGAIDVVDDRRAEATDLSETVSGASVTPAAASGFVRNGGAARPLPDPADGFDTLLTWGSLTGDGATETGRYTTPWFELPDVTGDQRLVVMTAGRLDLGNSLVAEFGNDSGAEVETQDLTDDQYTDFWRQFVLNLGPAKDRGATVVRLSALDQRGDEAGWLAMSQPAVQPVVSLQKYTGDEDPTAVSWQFSFLFPCQRQPVLSQGITEPAEYGVLWGNDGYVGFNDNTWQVSRAGVFAPVARNAAVVSVVAYLRDHPDVQELQVYRFENPYPTAAYDLTADDVTVMGWQPPPTGSS